MARENNYTHGKFTRTVDTVEFVVIDLKFDENGNPSTPVMTPFKWFGVNEKTFDSYIAKTFPAMTVAKLRDSYLSKITIDENDLYKAMQDGKIPFKIERIDENEQTNEPTATDEKPVETTGKRGDKK